MGPHDAIAPGSEVVMHFSLSLPDGTVAETTFDGEPMRLRLGDGTLVEGLELALYGLRPGDRQTLTLTPPQAFGLHDEAKVLWMARADFPEALPPDTETLMAFAHPSGEEVAGVVLAVEAGRVKVDFNHPLAGHPVVFEVEILAVKNERPGSE